MKCLFVHKTKLICCFICPICRKYKKKESKLSDKALILHRQWNNVDYQLYENFNTSLWKQINEYGQDFQDELALYKLYLQEIKAYCDPLVNQIFKNESSLDAIVNIFSNVKPLAFPKTTYGQAFEIDVVWCALTRVNIMEFYNIMRTKQFPALCDFLSPDAANVEPHQFRINDFKKTVSIWSGYCAKKEHDTLVSLKTVAGTLLWWAKKNR